MSIEDANCLLQRAYDATVGISDESFQSILNSMSEIPLVDIHHAAYDSGLLNNAEFIEAITKNPQGVLALVLKKVRDFRVSEGNYVVETLNSIYHLRD